MRRREILLLLGAAVLALPPLAVAQDGRVYRLGIFSQEPNADIDYFLQRLREKGYVQGQNLIVEARYDGGNAAQASALAAELAGLNLDAILASSSTYVGAAKRAMKDVPIIFAVHNDPVGTGDVESLAHPGGNITGLTQMATDVTAKQIQFLRDVIPNLRRLAILTNPTTPSNKLSLTEAVETGRRFGLELLVQNASQADDFERAYKAATQWHADGALILTSPASFVARRKLAQLALDYHLPTMLGFTDYVVSGGLISYAPDRRDLYGRAADYVAKIFRGAKPKDLPVEQPNTFELAVNLKTAKSLGLTIPQSLLVRADEVIQ